MNNFWNCFSFTEILIQRAKNAKRMRDWRRRRAMKLRNKDPSTTATASDASRSDLHVPTESQGVKLPELESEVLFLKKQIKRMKNYERVKRYRARKRAQQEASNAYETSQSESSDSMRKISGGQSLLKVKQISDINRGDVSIMAVSPGLLKTESNILSEPREDGLITNVSEGHLLKPQVSADQSILKSSTSISAIHGKDDVWIESQLEKLRKGETLSCSQEELEKKNQIKKLRNAANVRAYRERRRQLILEAESKLDTKLLEPEVVLTSDSHILLQPDNITSESPIPSYTEIPIYPDSQWTQLPFEPEVSLMEYRETSMQPQHEMIKKNGEIKSSKSSDYLRASRERQRNILLGAEKNLEDETTFKSESEECWSLSQVENPKSHQTDVWNPPLQNKALPSNEEIERRRLIQRKRNAERVRAHRERKRAALRAAQAESQAPPLLDLREAQATLEIVYSQKPAPLKNAERVRAYRERKRAALREAQGILDKPEFKAPRPLTSAERVRAYRERKRAALRDAQADFQASGPLISADQKRNALKVELQSAVSSMQMQSEVPDTKCQKNSRTPWSELKTLIQEARSKTLRDLEEAGINMEDNKFTLPHSQSQKISDQAIPVNSTHNTLNSSSTRQCSLEVTQNAPSQDKRLTEKLVIQRLKNAQYVRAFRERQRMLKALQTLPKTSQPDRSEGESKTLKVVISSEKDSPNKLKFRFIKDS